MKTPKIIGIPIKSGFFRIRKNSFFSKTQKVDISVPKTKKQKNVQTLGQVVYDLPDEVRAMAELVRNVDRELFGRERRLRLGRGRRDDLRELLVVVRHYQHHL